MAAEDEVIDVCKVIGPERVLAVALRQIIERRPEHWVRVTNCYRDDRGFMRLVLPYLTAHKALGRMTQIHHVDGTSTVLDMREAERTPEGFHVVVTDAVDVGWWPYVPVGGST